MNHSMSKNDRSEDNKSGGDHLDDDGDSDRLRKTTATSAAAANDYEDECYPFRNDCYKHLTLADKIQIAVMTITVAPIRLFFVGISLLLLWPFAFITTRGLTEDNRHEPLTGWRKNLVPLMRVLSRAVFFWAGFHRIRVIGEQNLDKSTPIVVVAPHTGFMDALFFVHANFLSGVARAGTEQVTIFGRVVKVFKCIIVNREKSASRSDTVQRLIERVERAEEARERRDQNTVEWPIIGLFPQGTCSNQRSLVRFKSGAFIPARPVQPVCIRYPSLRFDSISWTWEGPSVYALAWLTLCQFHIPVEFHILPPYKPSDEEKRNADLYAENVRRLMADYLNVPLSDLSYEDGRLMSKMDRFGLPNNCGTIQVHNIKKKFRINDDDIESLLPLFASLANKSTGLCHVEKFADTLGLKLTDTVEKLFKEFDSKNSGNFKFRDFVESYFGKIRPKVNEIGDIESFIIKSFDKFAKSEKSEYTFDELNSESKRRFRIEFNKNMFQIDRIGKDNLKSFFITNKLHLYLYSSSL